LVDRWETIPIRQTASWTSGVSWSDNHGEPGVGAYARDFGYDKVGNRTLMHLLDTDGDFVRDVTWTLEYNDLNQLDRRFTGATWAGSQSGEERWDYAYDDNGNLTSAIQETYNGSVWSESEEWVYEWNPRDQMTRAVKYAGGSANNAMEENMLKEHRRI
jgi:hypothetical protein